MSSRSDLEYLLLRANQPSGRTTTGDLYARTTRGLVTSARLQAGSDAATAVIRTGGASGTIVWNLAAATGLGDATEFPVGLLFDDGLHVTLSGTDPRIDIVGVADAGPAS